MKRLEAGRGRPKLRGLAAIVLAWLAAADISRGQALAPAYSSDFTLAQIGANVGEVSQMAFAPGDDSHLYVATYGQGILRYDYSPTRGLSNGATIVPAAITSQSGTNGSLGIAFSQDPTLGTVMYIAPSLTFTGVGTLSTQSIVRLTDTNHDGTWGGAGDVNQAIVNNLQLGGIHWIDQMQVQGNSLYLGIGTRTQNGGITTGQGDQSNPGETEYSGTISFIQDLTKLSGDTITPNIAGFTMSDPKTDTQMFTSTDPGKLRVYTTGLRNPYGLAFDNSGTLWATMNQNENPLLPDELHKITYQSDGGFAKQNDVVGDWKAGVTVPSQQAIAAGYFNPQNSVPIVATLGNDASADGLDFFPQTNAPADVRGDALIARWADNDLVVVDPTTGAVQSFATGLAHPLDVVRDPFGNMLVGENTATGRIFRIAPTAATGSGPVWTGAADANWATPGNWSTNLPRGPAQPRPSPAPATAARRSPPAGSRSRTFSSTPPTRQPIASPAARSRSAPQAE